MKTVVFLFHTSSIHSFAAFHNQGDLCDTPKSINKINFERNDSQMTNKQFFYGRVSTREQNEERQLQAAREFGIDERDIYIDKASGKDFNREQYQIMKSQLRCGDLVVFLSIDRMGRGYSEIIKEYREIIDIGCLVN